MSSSTNAASAFRNVYDLMFQVSPIIFSGGSVASSIGGLLPVLSFLGSFIGLDGLLPDIRFVPLPGATAISNSIGAYPFANQTVAANAIIRDPNVVSLMMISPVNSEGGYLTKMAAFLALKTSFEAHMASGGTFHVMTPAMPFMDCILTSMVDITNGTGHQQQVQWQLDFQQPLVTMAAAAAAFNGLMSKISGGQKITSSDWSGPAVAAAGAAPGLSVAQTFPVNLNNSVAPPL